MAVDLRLRLIIPRPALLATASIPAPVGLPVDSKPQDPGRLHRTGNSPATPLFSLPPCLFPPRPPFVDWPKVQCHHPSILQDLSLLLPCPCPAIPPRLITQLPFLPTILPLLLAFTRLHLFFVVASALTPVFHLPPLFPPVSCQTDKPPAASPCFCPAFAFAEFHVLWAIPSLLPLHLTPLDCIGRRLARLVLQHLTCLATRVGENA